MKNSKAAKILREFAENDIERLDKNIRDFTGDVLDTEKRIKALNRAADFLEGDSVSTNKLNKTLDYLEGIKEDYKFFKNEIFALQKHVKKAINTAMGEISEELKNRDYDDYPFPMWYINKNKERKIIQW